MLVLDRAATRKWLALMKEKPTKFEKFCSLMEPYARSIDSYNLTVEENKLTLKE